MKKKLLTLCLIFVFMFIVNINKVEGITTCEYGIKDSDGDTWEHKITLDVGGWDSISVNALKSPVYDDIASSEGYQDDTSEAGNYAYMYHKGDSVYYFYAKLYASEKDYNDVNGKCPETLQYSFSEDLSGVRTLNFYTMGLYIDDIAKGLISSGDNKWINYEPSSDIANKFGFSEKEGILILKDVKDKPLNEVLDVYGCYTYSVYYKAMATAKYNNGGSCDGSKEYSDTYNDILELCTAYRSSEMYVGDDGKVSSSCQTACTNLQDDVAELCHLDDGGGYCGSISSDVMTYVFKIFGFARYIVPAILVILSILDYIKAIASDSEDEMKKVSGRFAKRLLAAALIFIIPLIIDFILGMFDIPGLSADKPFCN